MGSIYDYQGVEVLTGDGSANYDAVVKSINHRGYSEIAPENTLPAFRLSKKYGYNYVETDIRFSSDGYPVCIHDATIDRTSNGTGTVASLTLAQLKSYDFGSWKSATYAGTTIPTFEEFLALCRGLALHPYIEIKAGTEQQIQGLVDTVEAYGLKGKCTWIGFGLSELGYVKSYDPYARLGYLVWGIDATAITQTQSLMTSYNDVFINAYRETDDTEIELAISAGIPVEFWTCQFSTDITEGNPYITGFTVGTLNAGKLLYEEYMSD